ARRRRGYPGPGPAVGVGGGLAAFRRGLRDRAGSLAWGGPPAVSRAPLTRGAVRSDGGPRHFLLDEPIDRDRVESQLGEDRPCRRPERRWRRAGLKTVGVEPHGRRQHTYGAKHAVG